MRARLAVIFLGTILVPAHTAWGQVQALPSSDLTAGGGLLSGQLVGPPMDIPLAPGESYVIDHSRMGAPGSDIWTWQWLPSGLMYHPYLAGTREPRMGTDWVYEHRQGWLWDATLGAQIGLLRFGSLDDAWPEGWQIDMEGAAFPRLNLEENRDVDDIDFRFGFPLTFRKGRWEAKFAFVHYCSHLGDEYAIRNPGTLANRVNYVRDSLVAGVAFRPVPEIRLYSEAAWAYYTDGGAEPWEFQFGAEISPLEVVAFGGAPFLAVNGHLRQEVNFSGSLVVQTGWQWRGRSGQLLRCGFQYFNGKSDQGQFINSFEEQIGIGIWYDF